VVSGTDGEARSRATRVAREEPGAILVVVAIEGVASLDFGNEMAFARAKAARLPLEEVEGEGPLCCRASQACVCPCQGSNRPGTRAYGWRERFACGLSITSCCLFSRSVVLILLC
jgi:hypothetical protein